MSIFITSRCHALLLSIYITISLFRHTLTCTQTCSRHVVNSSAILLNEVEYEEKIMKTLVHCLLYRSSTYGDET